MRDQGRLTNWNDDKGFGFVTPDQGGLRAFVHIRAFSYRMRRPRDGDVITYQLTWDNQGRPRAENVLFREQPGGKTNVEAKPHGVLAASLFATSFMAAIVTLAAFGKLHWLVPLVWPAAGPGRSSHSASFITNRRR
jgi:cold shock CspA family protein